MKRSVSIIVLMFCLFSFGLQAQDVTLISTGEGATKELAIRNAQVAAVEQAYGVYVSGNTKILNDELIRDEVIQIKRGNIKNYKILSEALLGNKTWSVILETTVSTDKLLKFAESKGAVCELAGKTFAANLKLYRLHVSNGAEAMKYLYGLLGTIAPKIYDYKLNLGEPIVYKSDVYIPVAVDCITNDNYETFIELYNSTYNSVKASIESVPVQGDTDDKDLSVIERYKEYIQYLPKIWAMGFRLSDNIGNSVVPQFNSLLPDNPFWSMPDNAFWPSVDVKKYKIERHYNDLKYIYGLPPHSYIMYFYNSFTYTNIIFLANGIRIQQLDYDPLCSLGEGQSGGKVLRDYVRKVEQKFSVATTGVSYANNAYDIRDIDNRMVIWNHNKSYKWIDEPAGIAGIPFCTVNFFLCYKEADIAKVSDIKVLPISQEN